MERGTVLVADSHSPMLEGVRSLLQDWFESVVMVADEKSLLQSADKLQPELVVVDVSLPVSGTKKVVTVLRERYPEIRLIALSIHDESVAVERVLASGASAFVLKRCTTTDLIPAVNEVLAGRVYVSPDAKGPLHGPHTKNPDQAKHRIPKDE